MAITTEDIDAFRKDIPDFKTRANNFETAIRSAELSKYKNRNYIGRVTSVRKDLIAVSHYLGLVETSLKNPSSSNTLAVRLFYNYATTLFLRAAKKLDRLDTICSKNGIIIPFITCLVTSAIAWCGTKTSPTQKFD